jgi:ketosteroid isomerase-like protein
VKREEVKVQSKEASDKSHGTLLSWRAVKKEAPREEKPKEKKARTPSPEPVKSAASLPAAQHEAPVEPPILQPARQPARVEKGIEVVSAPPPAPASGGTPGGTKVTPKATGVTPEEVQRFLAEYMAAFERGDIGRFMALFSRSAVENGSRSYEEIRRAYAASFEGKEKTRYRVKDVEVDPSEREAVVRGRFEISQQRKQDGRKMEAQGAIRWRLIREGEQLKVATVDYVRQ